MHEKKNRGKIREKYFNFGIYDEFIKNILTRRKKRKKYAL